MKAMYSVVVSLFKFLSSYLLSIILLSLLMLLVFIGTIEQVNIGLYEAQHRYFMSFWAIYPLFGTIPIPLPGGYLLLALVFINMICGAIITAPKRIDRPGLIIAHFGIIFLIFSGLATEMYATSGHVTLYEGQETSTYQSYYDWEIRITETGAGSQGKQWIIPEKDLDTQGTGRFTHPDLPFVLSINRFFINSRPINDTSTESVEGVMLVPVESFQDKEKNLPGVSVGLSGAIPDRGLLWGGEEGPMVVTAKDRQYTLSLNRRQWALPFSIKLEKFTRELHPGTQMPSMFSSRVTVTENGIRRPVDIQMNEPLRHKGYTFFQSSWGPPDAQPGTPLFSVLAASQNPAGDWPMYASYIISLGLLLHFIQLLWRYLRAGAGKVNP